MFFGSVDNTWMKRALIYVRTSLDMTGEGASVARQEEACRALAVARGWEVVGVEVDNSRTGFARSAWSAACRTVDDPASRHQPAGRDLTWRPGGDNLSLHATRLRARFAATGLGEGASGCRPLCSAVQGGGDRSRVVAIRLSRRVLWRVGRMMREFP
jgi:Resolvase, N terminal domain